MGCAVDGEGQGKHRGPRTLYSCVRKASLLSFWCGFFFLKRMTFLRIFLKFIYFWLHWVFVAARACSSCSEWGLLFVVVHGLLIAVASLVAEHRL